MRNRQKQRELKRKQKQEEMLDKRNGCGVKDLTAEIIREFVEKIYVYNAEKVNGKRVHKIRIVWNCIGEFDVPHERINGAAG